MPNKPTSPVIPTGPSLTDSTKFKHTSEMISFRISKQPQKTVLLTLFITTALLVASPAVAQQYQFSDQGYHNGQTWSPNGSPQQHRFYNAGYQQQSGSAPTPASAPKAATASDGESEPEEIDLKELAKEVAALQAKDLPAYTAGYDGGFRIKPRDKKKNPFDLKINGRLQFRWAAFARDRDTFTNRLGTIGVPDRNDFEIERGRLEFKGNILDSKTKFYFNLDADTDDNHDVIFHDFWFDRVVNDHLTIRLGKAKVPGSYEWLESSTSTRFADRSVSTTYFRADRSLGIWFLGETPNDTYYQIAVTNGFVSTDLEPEDVDNNFAYTILSYRDFGSDFGKGHSDLEFHETPSTRIGYSASYTNTNPLDGDQPSLEQNFARVSDGARLTDTGALTPGLTINDFDQYFLSTFISGKWRGFSYNAEYYARWLQNFGTIEGPSTSINSLFDSGFYVDVGYFLIPERLEVNARVSQIDGLFGDSWEYAAGWNYFINGTHKNKLSFDATVLDGIPTSSSSPNFELGQDGILYRLQYQIAF